MKKRISLIFCVVAVMWCVLALGAAAMIYEPDSNGQYTVELEMQPNNEYLMVVLKGKYDQTNYIEAYAAAEDSDILYFEQKASDADGKVTFGPFVPFGYYDSTVILGGTDLDELYLAGCLSVEGVSNSANVAVSGIEKTYIARGVDSDDYVIEVETEVRDSFGYPSVTNEEVIIELQNAMDGVSVDGNVITVSKIAKEQTFAVVVSAGDASKTIYVNVVRQTPVHNYIEVYEDETFEQAVDVITVAGTAESYPSVTVFAKSFDQYMQEIQDTYSYTYAGENVESTFVPVDGQNVLTVNSTVSNVKKSVIVNTVIRPDYNSYALELYNLIADCKEIYAEEKIISSDGRDVFPEDKYITQTVVDAFASAITSAETALEKYGNTGYTDNDYADEVTALTKARDTYNGSFKNGSRTDVTSISFENEEFVLVLGDDKTKKVDVSPVTEPTITRTTDIISWSSSDENVAKITQISTDAHKKTATVTAVGSGKATITATTRAGMSASFDVSVIKPAKQIMLSPSTVTATYGEEKTILTAKVSPKDCTDIIEWSYDSAVMDLEYNEYIEGAYRVVEATVVPKTSTEKTKVKATAVYGGVSSPECSVTTVMPDWGKADTPKPSIPSGPVYPGTEVSLTSTENATIYYTLDGTIPSRTNGRLYKKPIVINQSLTLKARAVGNELYDSGVVTCEYTVVDSLVSVSSAVAREGEEVNIFVDVEGFEEVEWAEIVLKFDHKIHEDHPAVKYESSASFEIYNVEVDDSKVGYLTIVYNSDKLSKGRLLYMCFSVYGEEGEYPIEVVSAKVRVRDEATGAVNEYDAATVDGKITLNNYLIGDANDDGKIGLADVLLIKQYAQGKESAIKNILLSAADVDGDGDVDNDDANLVSKYCVGWDVTFANQK